ncbi:MAG: neutral zinc metallopeptidase [Actinomycetota bacterium]
MRWRRRRRSPDLQDRRGAPGGPRMGAIGAGLGIPGVIVLVLVMVLTGGDESELGDVLGGLENPRGPAEAPIPRSQDPDADLVGFMSFVLDDAQNFWSDTFAQSDKRYERAQLVLFEQSTHSACGGATEQIGPHYCPVDQKVYLHLDFLRELRRRFGAPGDFAQAYVLAHEIGHHVQKLLGIEARVRRDQRSNPGEANELSVRMELQADCFAGVWAFTTYERELLERGDLQEGLDAAAAVGDDRIQAQAGERVNPENWTHGSSDQRTSWFSRGFEDGDPNACDTFAAEL